MERTEFENLTLAIEKAYLKGESMQLSLEGEIVEVSTSEVKTLYELFFNGMNALGKAIINGHDAATVGHIVAHIIGKPMVKQVFIEKPSEEETN